MSFMCTDVNVKLKKLKNILINKWINKRIINTNNRRINKRINLYTIKYQMELIKAYLHMVYFFIFQGFSLSLRLNEVIIPNHTIRGSTTRLECQYELDTEDLYSVKWYKDGNEFYRYVPRDMPPATVFPVLGVTVDLHNSTDRVIVLQSVNLSSSGRYRCEVSGEAPSFQTVSDHGDMIVVAVPDEGPRITGGRPRYQIGDTVKVNCTSGRSKPRTHLSWYINGEQAEPGFQRTYDVIITGKEGLEITILGLEFKVRSKHFRRGDMKLKCLATIASIYWRSNEESVEGDRLQKAPEIQESRDTAYVSKSRADRVQASNSADYLCIHKFIAVLNIAIFSWVTSLFSTLIISR